QIMEGARHHRSDDHAFDLIPSESFKLKQLVQTDRILIGCAAWIRSDAPARLDPIAIHQSEDDVGIPGIDREDHGRALAMSAALHNSTSPARMMSREPSPRRRRSAPSASIPSTRPDTDSSALA